MYKQSVKHYSNYDLQEMGRKSLAVRRLNQAVSNGTMVRKDICEVCNRPGKTVAHHWNGHDKWFDVWWICRRCNSKLRFHDGSVTLDAARKRIAFQCFEDPIAYYDYIGEKNQSCDICGVPDKISSMLLCDNDTGGTEYICQRCYGTMR